MSECHIGVFGAGVVGLQTCLELQRVLRNARISVIADKFNEDTTSDGAAGLFQPAYYFSGPTLQITEEWLKNSYEIYNKYMKEPGCGIKELSGYMLSSDSYELTRNHYMEKLVPFRELDEDELKDIYPGHWKYGSFCTTLVIECRQHQPWAIQRFLNNGGSVIHGKLNSFSEVEKFGKFDVVVNCTGLGSKALCGDNRMVPIRGQVLKVDAPWLRNFYFADYSMYIIPGISAVTLGGCREFGSWDTKVDKHISKAIMERCTAVIPRLATAPVLREWVGLRPHRDVVRVAPEIINGLKVVHNYGHGGYGVTTAPGTARAAAIEVLELLRSTSAKY